MTDDAAVKGMEPIIGYLKRRKNLGFSGYFLAILLYLCGYNSAMI